jgi:hypothetical protein
LSDTQAVEWIYLARDRLTKLVEELGHKAPADLVEALAYLDNAINRMQP